MYQVPYSYDLRSVYLYASSVSVNSFALVVKASQQIGILSCLKNLVPVPAKLTLFKSAILPHLMYCQKVWHFARAPDKRKLERIQERALCVIYLDKISSYEDLLKRANLDTLN